MASNGRFLLQSRHYFSILEIGFNKGENASQCSHKKKCSVGLFVSFREPIRTQTTGGNYYAFTDDTVDDKILNKDNYKKFHTVTLEDAILRLLDGLRDSTKHDPDCYKKWISKSK